MSVICCGDCAYLTRTSPEQVFLKCAFWSAKNFPVRGASKAMGKDYAITHCHMQPEAPACPYFKLREVVANDAASVGAGYAHDNALLPAT